MKKTMTVDLDQDQVDFMVVESLKYDYSTMAIFSAIVGFWFGSRAITNLTNIYTKNPSMFNINTGVNTTKKK